MGSIRPRKENGLLMFDFRYQGVRCREQTTLADNKENRSKIEKVLKRIEAEITLGTFVYADYFPNSPLVQKFSTEVVTDKKESETPSKSPLFRTFAWEWYGENIVRWKDSYRKTAETNLKKHLIPAFGEKEVSHITRAEILKFRSALAKVEDGKKGLSPDRINHIMTTLRMILEEAADRFEFTTSFTGIKQLRVPKSDVDPFSLDEVMMIIGKVRKDFRNYYIVRFFTGMRTAELDGLKWKYVDFVRRQILVRETIVEGKIDTTKTPESMRTIEMSSIVYKALKEQHAINVGRSEYVFCARNCSPLQHRNVTKRVWYPTLRLLGLKTRRPYQTRHTAATLWLAAGENPEWIARQMGHVNTRMLFTVYSRFVPNLTRRDGSAFENFLIANYGRGDFHGCE
ncbi:MAG TPA: DUF3596 domain-containing protein [Geobacteraceae bacterium]|nr:DUF3596 domain-containing protein [Geobacteraceae bacterium]